MPTNSPAVTQPDVPRASVKIDSLAQHQQGWLRIRRQSAAGKPSTARGALEKNGAFRISTSNVQSFSIDARALPVDTSRQIIMHIDGQNMVVFANGDTLTFLRARNGNWEYQKE